MKDILMASEATLRDMFAAKAMQGILASGQRYFGPSDDEGKTNADLLATNSYFMADAMRKQREKEPIE